MEEDKRTGEDSEDGEEQVEVLTADKSQGRDKECVIVSMVRSNDEGRVCSVFNSVLSRLRRPWC